MPKHHFKEGDIVCHKGNLNLELTVSRILKESREFIKGFDTKTNMPIKEIGIKMIGIEVHWWEPSKSDSTKNELQIHKFHSSELIPVSIAKLGKEKVEEWILKQIRSTRDHI